MQITTSRNITRRIILIGTLVSTLCLVAACDGFLQVEPETFVSSESFYENESQIRLAVNGLYANVQSLHNQLQWTFSEMRSDNTSFQYNPGNRGRVEHEDADLFLMDAGNRFVESYWDISYNGISRANNILTSIGEVSFQDEGTELTRTGEAQFFRAFHYFNLVRLYGRIPIVTEPLTSPEEAGQPQRASIDSVYEQVIIPGALNAIENLPESYSSSQRGRITKGAARTLLAKTYMVREAWNDAEGQLRAIVESGQYRLLDDYGAIFEPSNKNNDEIVFSVQYLGGEDNGEASDFMSGQLGFAPYNSGTAVIGTGVEGFTGVHTTAGRNQPTQDMIEAYENGDERKPASMKTFFVTTEGDTVHEAYINKYCCHMVKAGQENVNWPVYRYADVLLMLSEALFRQGQVGEARTHINQVRERADLDPLSTLDEEAIRRERRVELAFENHRWFDLLRWNIAEGVLQDHGEGQKELKEPLPSEAYTNIRTLLPIPDEEVQSFGYEQNPGY